LRWVNKEDFAKKEWKKRLEVSNFNGMLTHQRLPML
jgi:hypothetical protein